MHFCSQEAFAIASLVPLVPWLLSKVIWLRARYKHHEPAPAGGGWSETETVEVRECRGCGEEIGRKA
jgi:hypothetical protein